MSSRLSIVEFSGPFTSFPRIGIYTIENNVPVPPGVMIISETIIVPSIPFGDIIDSHDKLKNIITGFLGVSTPKEQLKEMNLNKYAFCLLRGAIEESIVPKIMEFCKRIFKLPDHQITIANLMNSNRAQSTKITILEAELASAKNKIILLEQLPKKREISSPEIIPPPKYQKS